MKIFETINPDSKIGIDTNILIYLFTNQDKYKKKIAEGIWLHYKFKCIPYQVVKELTKILTAKFNIPFDEVKILIGLLYQEAEEIFFPDKETIFIYFDIMKKYNFNFWDGFIIAKCLQNGCDYLISEDFQDGMIIENKMQIINPFK